MNPTNISSNPDLEMGQQGAQPPKANVCLACGATNVATQFCTSCGAEASKPLDHGTDGVIDSVRTYFGAVAAVNRRYNSAVRAWFPFAWRTAVIAIPPFAVICAVVFLTVLLTSAGFARVAMESHSLDTSEAARLMEQTQNRVLHNLGELRIAAFAALLLCVSPVAFKSKSIQRAIGRERDDQPVSLKNAFRAACSFHWRFWLLMIPAAILIWLLAYEPIVLFGQMTKGEEELVKRVAMTVSEVLVLLATTLVSIMPFLDGRFARTNAIDAPNKASK